MSFAQFIVAASVHAMNSHMSMGRAYMESLRYHRPDLFQEITERPIGMQWKVNPTKDDALFPNFLAFIAERWDMRPDRRRESDGVGD